MLAPGAIITAAGISMGGTSQATPHVSGAVAVAKGHDTLLTVDEVISRLTSTGVPVLDDRNNITKPRLDLYGLVTITNPIIGFTPSTFSFMGAAGGLNPAGKVMSITNNGEGTLNWSVGSSQAWLTPAPVNGTGAGNVTLSVNTTGLSAGIYNAVITITAAGALNTPQTVPVTLEVINTAYSEDFEAGNLTKFPWATGGSSAWTVQNSIKHTGGFAVKSPVMTDSQLSYLEVTLNVTSPGDISFWYKVSSEPRWDKLVFRIDGSIKGTWEGYAGEIDWSQETVSVTAGIHTFRWEYSKDGNLSQGSDAVWLDDIFFPPSNTLVPMPSVSPLSKDFGSVPVAGTSAAQTFTVSNTGTGNLVIGTLSLLGGDAANFTKQNDTCTGQTVIPAGSCTVEVKFTPSSTGSKSATLSIPTNYPVTTTAALSGTGTVSYTLTVNKTGSTGTGTVTSEPSGINCGPDCTEPYNSGIAVTLTAAPDAGSSFAGWSGGGCSGTGSCAVTINSNTTVTAIFNTVPPIADFTGSPVTGDALLNVSFFDSSSNNPVSWSWTFGDGGTSTLQNPSHVYENPGTYTVSLTATNAGGPSTTTKTNYITVTSLPLRISGAPPSYYSSLTAAYGLASGGDTIQGRAEIFTEDLNCNRNISVTLKGGYNATFTENSGFTTISGSLAISSGTVTVENLIIQ
jgi:PKD repeat protein